MPLLRVRDTWIGPPGGWRYPCFPDRPLTGKDSDFIWGGTLDHLVEQIHDFRVANRLDLGDPRVEAMNWMCRNTGARCVPSNPAKPMPGVKANSGMVARFISAMIAWVRSDEIVPQEESERRASICSGCAWNVPLESDNCFGCYGMGAKIMQVIGNRRTKMDERLQFCGRCGCSLKIVVHAPLEVLNRAHRNDYFPTDTGQTENGLPVPCWRKLAAQ